MGYPVASCRGKQIARAVESGFVPTDIAGCVLWLRADGITGLSDGDAVTTWPDESGEGNDATQATTAKKPSYETGVLNGLPVVRFDGVDDLLQGSSDLTVRTIFAVVKSDDLAPEYDGLVTGQAGTDGDLGLLVTPSGYYTNSQSGAIWYVNGTQTSSVADWSEFHIAVVKWSGYDYTTSYQIGNDRGIGGRYLQGDVAEILIYDSVLSDGDREAVRDYLNDKYAIY